MAKDQTIRFEKLRTLLTIWLPQFIWVWETVYLNKMVVFVFFLKKNIFRWSFRPCWLGIFIFKPTKPVLLKWRKRQFGDLWIDWNQEKPHRHMYGQMSQIKVYSHFQLMKTTLSNWNQSLSIQHILHYQLDKYHIHLTNYACSYSTWSICSCLLANHAFI